MKRFLNIRFFSAALIGSFLLAPPSQAWSQQYEFSGGLTLQGYVNNGQNPFWDYTNTLGIISDETQFLAVLDGYYRTYLAEDTDLEIGASFFTDIYGGGKNNIRANEYFASVKWLKFRATVGARARPEKYMGISSVNGDILWSNNARPMPGMEVQTMRPLQILPWFGVEGALAHFWLNNDRYVTGAYVHYKHLTLNFQLTDYSRLKAGIQHYAQWGGISPQFGSQPAGFGDYWRVFVGIAGDEAFAIAPGEPALGNHIGSYQLEFQQELNDGSLSVYHQHLFEDGSGARLENFGDGLWGVFWELPENSAVRGLVYEFVQTTDQSGPPPPPGDDNYFNHYIYESGWTYKDRTVGVPFLIATDQIPAFNNNRVTAHHLGARISSFDENWDFRVMTSLVKNRGTWEFPFEKDETVFYGHMRIRRLINEQMQVGFTMGTDVSSVNTDNFAVGVSFRYVLGESLRIIPEQ